MTAGTAVPKRTAVEVEELRARAKQAVRRLEQLDEDVAAQRRGGGEA